jgi:hypothetical protein
MEVHFSLDHSFEKSVALLIRKTNSHTKSGVLYGGVYFGYEAV